jgi:hypothetical protein
MKTAIFHNMFMQSSTISIHGSLDNIIVLGDIVTKLLCFNRNLFKHVFAEYVFHLELYACID